MQQSLVFPDAPPPWVRLAYADIGTEETLDNGKLNPKVRDYFLHTTFPWALINRKTAWCAAAMCAWLERSGFRSPHSASSLAFLTWGEPCDPLFFGSVLVFSRPVSGTQPGNYGHVTLSVGHDERDYHCLGGNQRNSVCIAEYQKPRLLGARLPLGFAKLHGLASHGNALK
jgi:uncharacterized protein (TIGR02594 family)